MVKKQDRPKTEEIKQIYIHLRNDIRLHEKSIEVLGNYATKYDTQAQKKIEGVLKKAKIKSAKISHNDIEILLEFFNKYPTQGFLFKKNTLVSIVSALDDVFSSIFKYYYANNPGKLSLENRSITYTELEQVEKVEDAKAYLLEREIETILRNEGLGNRLGILKDEMGISLPTNQTHLHELNRIIKIRNLIVHNSCKADGDYIKKYAKDAKKGESIPLDNELISSSLQLVFYMAGHILQAVQIKYPSKKLTDNDYVLNDVMHTLLKKNAFSYLKEIYSASKDLGLNEMSQKLIVINFCIGLKKQGKNREHIDKILDKEDWSVRNDIIELGLYALRDHHKEFYAQLKKLIKTETVGKLEILDWEIFSLYNKKSEFREIIKKIIK